jgi:hypothetical protein
MAGPAGPPSYLSDLFALVRLLAREQAFGIGYSGMHSPPSKSVAVSSLPSASFNDMRTVAEAEIVREINGHLAALNGSIAEWRKPHHALQAQLLMQELTRREFELAQREQRRQTNYGCLYRNNHRPYSLHRDPDGNHGVALIRRLT